jgi:hypothetical protein
VWSPRAPIFNALENRRNTMRKTMLALAATGFLGLGSIGASAVTPGPLNGADHARTAQGNAIQKADWYCGPRCQYSRERRWEEHRRWDEGRRWRDYNRGYNRYGYNGGGYGYYNR